MIEDNWVTPPGVKTTFEDGEAVSSAPLKPAAPVRPSGAFGNSVRDLLNKSPLTTLAQTIAGKGEGAGLAVGPISLGLHLVAAVAVIWFLLRRKRR